MNCPGLKIVMPYYAGDAYGLMKAAIRDDDPVLFFYPEGSLGKKSEVADEEFVIPLNNAANVRREGSEATHAKQHAYYSCMFQFHLSYCG